MEQVTVGDTIRVCPGESFAVDGRILAGEGSVNEASITGEATPAYKGVGDPIYAGSAECGWRLHRRSNAGR